MKKSEVKVTKEKMSDGGIGLVIETKNVRFSITLDDLNNDIILHSSDSRFEELWITDEQQYIKRGSSHGFIRLLKIKP